MKKFGCEEGGKKCTVCGSDLPADCETATCRACFEQQAASCKYKCDRCGESVLQAGLCAGCQREVEAEEEKGQ